MKIEKAYNLNNLSEDYLLSTEGIAKKREITKKNAIYRDIYKELFHEMIVSQYTLLIGSSFRLSIVRQVRNYDKLAVNWGASNKYKEEILARGGKPASKIGVDAKGNPKFDDGERWLIFFTDFDFIKLHGGRVRHKDPKGKWFLPTPEAWFWKVAGNIKTVGRVNEYITKGIIKREDIKLYDRHKENFF